MEQDFPYHWLRFFANLLSQFWLRNLISNPNPPMFAAPSFSQFSSPYMSRCLSSRTDCTRSDMFRDCQPPRLQMLQHALCAGRYTTPRIQAPCPINQALETNSSRKTEHPSKCSFPPSLWDIIRHPFWDHFCLAFSEESRADSKTDPIWRPLMCTGWGATPPRTGVKKRLGAIRTAAMAPLPTISIARHRPHITRTSPAHRPHIARCKKCIHLRIAPDKEGG